MDDNTQFIAVNTNDISTAIEHKGFNNIGSKRRGSHTLTR